jgi:hypothetical protein
VAIRPRQRRGVISLATGRRDYGGRLSRLKASLRRVGFEGELVCWPPGRFPAGCPEHLESPFAFKPFCLAEAGERGIRSVLWLDASCIAIRSLDPLFDAIDERGYLLFRNRRYVVGEWASDEALALLGLTRAEALRIPEVRASAVGLRLDHPVADRFLSEWHRLAEGRVAFRGTRDELLTRDDYYAVKWNRDGRVSADPRVRGHRHDQTVAGILAHRLGMELRAGGLESYTRATRFLPIQSETAVVVDRRYRPLVGRWALRARRDRRLAQVAARVRAWRPRSR